MRIVQLIDSLDYGGAEQVVASLAASQSHHGDLVHLVCLRGLGSNPVNTVSLIEAGVEIVTLSKPPGFHIGTLRKLVAYLKDHQIDVVHTHNHIVHHYGALAGHLAGTRAIVNTLHGSASLQTAPRWAKFLFWLSCVISDRVVSVCAEVHTGFQKSFRLQRRKLCVVENGIDLSRFVAIPRRTRGEIVTFGIIGRLEPVKDHENLLRAFAILRRKHSHVQLRILGDGTLRPDLERLVKTLSIADCVHFEGFSLETACFLGSIDVYVISSRSEGLPLTLLEAMGAALPVVATAVGAVPDILNKASCGWLCSPASPDELASAMEKALLTQDLEQIGKRSREAVEEQYALDRMAQDYQHLYEAVLFGHTARSKDPGG